MVCRICPTIPTEVRAKSLCQLTRAESDSRIHRKRIQQHVAHLRAPPQCGQKRSEFPADGLRKQRTLGAEKDSYSDFQNRRETSPEARSTYTLSGSRTPSTLGSKRETPIAPSRWSTLVIHCPTSVPHVDHLYAHQRIAHPPRRTHHVG